MKKLILSIIILLTSSFQSTAHVEHYAKFDYLEYELFRNNKSIGYHNYKFERNEQYLEVKSVIKFKITKLGVDLYKYNAVSEEEYKENQLIKFSSKTIQNKKNKNTEINFDEKKKRINYYGIRKSIILTKRAPSWNLVEP